MAKQSHKTITEIADKLGVKRHRVRYAVEVLGLTPAELRGSVALFDAAQVKQITDSLRAVSKFAEGKGLPLTLIAGRQRYGKPLTSVARKRQYGKSAS